MSFRDDVSTHVGLWKNILKNRLLKLTENMKECMSGNLKMSDIGKYQRKL